MAVTASVSCTEVSGNAASFVAEVRVAVDGVIVADLRHDTSGTDGWTFLVDLGLTGAHTVRVTDVAASGPQEFLVTEQVLTCAAPGSTSTSTAPTTSPTATPTSAASVTTLPGGTATSSTTTLPVTTAVVAGSTVPTGATSATTVVPTPTTATVLGTGVTVAPSVPVQVATPTTAVAQTSAPAAGGTLPATGAGSAPLAGAGLGFLVAGVAALVAARRFRRSPT